MLVILKCLVIVVFVLTSGCAFVESSENAPKLVFRYKSLPGIVMDDLDVECRTVAVQPINVTWFKNGIPIEKITRYYKYLEDRQILRIPTLKLTDGGNYTCIVSNQYGSIKHTIEVIPLELLLPASFAGRTSKIREYCAVQGQDLNVSAEVDVSNTANVQLVKHLEDNFGKGRLHIISTPRDIILLRTESDRQGNKFYRYQIVFKFLNITVEDYGEYSIIAGSHHGFDVMDFTIVNKTDKVIDTTPGITESEGKDTRRNKWLIIIISLGIGLVVIFVAILLLWRRIRKLNSNKFMQEPALILDGPHDNSGNEYFFI